MTITEAQTGVLIQYVEHRDRGTTWRRMTHTDDEFFAAVLADRNRGLLRTMWLRLLAQLGNVDAQVIIGRTLMYGSGLKRPDPLAAAKWLRMAAERGHPEAAKHLETLLNSSTY